MTNSKSPNSHHAQTVIRAGAISIVVNLILTIIKIVLSAISGSLAIFSDALHGVVDTLSGLIVIIAEKIKPHALKHGARLEKITSEPTLNRQNSQFDGPTSIHRVDSSSGPTSAHSTDQSTKPHRLTHADIERLGARIIAVIIILVAVHILIEAIEGLISPPEISFSLISIIILAITIIAKIALAIYLQKTSRTTKSATLKASAVEAFNDSLISVAVLISTLIYLIWSINLEAYLSIILAIFIFKTGIDLFRTKKSA